jgi:uncharacterized protein (DUF697 family)
MARATTTVNPTEIPEGSRLETTVVLSPEERLAQAEAIVKNNVYWSMGVGMVPIPVVDLVGLSGFQIRMIKDLSHLYGVHFCDHSARNIVTALVGSIGARGVTVLTVGSLIKTLPMFGAVIGGLLAMPLISGAFTYGVGRVFVRHFEMGGTFLDFNTDKAKSYFSSQFHEGKRVVTETKPGATTS